MTPIRPRDNETWMASKTELEDRCAQPNAKRPGQQA